MRKVYVCVRVGPHTAHFLTRVFITEKDFRLNTPGMCERGPVGRPERQWR